MHKIKHMQIPHLEDVHAIEQECFKSPWGIETFAKYRRNCYHDCRVILCEDTGVPIGYIVLERESHRWVLLNIAVTPKHQGKGVGRALIEYFIKRLRADGRRQITETVRETNTKAQKFYKALGFVALPIIKRNAFAEVKEDAYELVYLWEWSSQGIEANGPPARCDRRNHLCCCCGECATTK